MYMGRVMGTALREVRAVAQASSATHARLRDRLVAIAVATVGVDLVCAVVALLLERGPAHSQVTGLGTALFWTSTQLLTVSSSVQNPLTTGGRILDVGMEAYAVTVVATLAGALGAFLIKRGEELDRG